MIPMQTLKDCIRKEGIVLPGNILKVDSFLNHQIDPVLSLEMGKELAAAFAGQKIDRVLTIEASGIAIGMATALALHVNLVFAKKKKTLVMNEDAYTSDVFSYTKKETNHISVLKKFLPPNENVLIVDDFLATGAAALGLADLVRQAGSHVAGVGVAIEKAFQPGHKKLEEAGYKVRALASIASLDNNQIRFTRE